MKIVYFSKGTRGSICLAHILEAGYEVLAVVGVSPEVGLTALSEEYGFQTIYPERINSPASVTRLRDYNADLFVLSGYNKILKKQVIEIPPMGVINLHGGRLPEYRGAAPINWQIIQGEKTGGCCIIYVDEGIDTGDIIAQEIYPITPEDTHASVLEKTLEIFPRLLVESLKRIEAGTVQAQKQDKLKGKYYTRRYPRDSKIDWKTMTDIQVHNLVRGMHGPYPAAFTTRAGRKIEIDQTRLLDEIICGVPGRVPHKRGSAVVALAANKGLLIEKITVDGEQVDPAAYFKIGDDLE